VLRLQRFRALEHLDLAAAAAEAGYADQAHLTRDCRDLTGLTPRALRND
jgi:AraC-like DNA-binding protein